MRYNKPMFKVTEIFDIITASGADDGEDITKGIANPEKSGSVDFSDAILDPVPGDTMNRLKGLFPEQ